MADIPAPGSATAPRTPEDFEKIYREFFLERKRIESIADMVEKMGAQFAVKSIKEVNQELLKIRETFKNDVGAYKNYLEDVSNEYSAVLSAAEQKFKETVKARIKAQTEANEIIRKNLSEFKKSFSQTNIDIEQELNDLAAITTDATENIAENLQEKAERIRKSLTEKLLPNNEDVEKEVKRVQDAIKEAEEKYESGATREERDQALAKKIALIREQAALKAKQNEADSKKAQIDALVNSKIELETEVAIQNIQEQQLVQQISLAKYEKIRADNAKELEGSMGGVLDKMLKTSSQSGLLSNSFFSILGNVNGIGAGIKDFSTNITKGLTAAFLEPQAAIARVVNFIDKNLIQSTFEFDKVMASINKNTGGFGKEFERISFNTTGPFKTSAIADLATYGINLEKFGAAYTTLSKNVGNFNNLLDSQRSLLAKNAAQMENLGVSVDTYGKLTTQFMGVMGKSVDQVKTAINDVAKDAINLGMDIGKYSSELQSLMPKIVGFGREATTIFKELSALSQATKGALSAADFSGFAAQFDTFDSAAQSVAKMNMVLGGTGVNLLEIMKLDPSERIMAIKESFDKTGKSFDDMNIGQKRAMAELFGGDVAKAAAFFRMDLAEAQDMMDKQLASEKELEERKKKSATAQEKLNAAIDSMKIAFTPIIDLVSRIADGISYIANMPGGPLIAFGTILAGLFTGAMFALQKFKLAASNAMQAAVAPVKELQVELRVLQQQLSSLQAQAKSGGGAIGNSTALSATREAARAEVAAAGGGGGAPAATGGMSRGAKIAGGLAIAGIALMAGQAYFQSQKEEEKRKQEEALRPISVPEIKDGIVMTGADGVPRYINIDSKDSISRGPFGSIVASKPGGPMQQFNDSVSNSPSYLNNQTSLLNSSDNQISNIMTNTANNITNTSQALLGAAAEKSSAIIEKTATVTSRDTERITKEIVATAAQNPKALHIELTPNLVIGEKEKQRFTQEVITKTGEAMRFKGPIEGVL